MELLAKLAATGEVSTLQMYKGFQRVVDQLDDLALDTPGLHAAYHDFYAACVAHGTIDAADATAIEAAERAASVEAALPDDGAAGERALTPPPPAQPHTVPQFKRASVAAVREYFDSSDADEVARILTVRPPPPTCMHAILYSCTQTALPPRARPAACVTCTAASGLRTLPTHDDTPANPHSCTPLPGRPEAFNSIWASGEGGIL